MALDVASVFALLERYGYILVFLGGLAEALPLLGLLVPGQAIILLAGWLAATGRLSITLVILVAIPAGILGDAFTYYLGRVYGRTLLEKYGPRLRIGEKQLAKSDALFAKYGIYALIIARFSFLTRGIGALLAGMSKVRQAVFWPVNIVGGLLWAVTYSALGYFFGAAYLRLEGVLGRILTITLLAAVGLYMLYRFLRKYAEQFTRDDLYVALLGITGLTGFGVLANLIDRRGRDTVLDRLAPDLVVILEPLRSVATVLEVLGSYVVLGVVSLGLLGFLAWRRRAWEATLVGMGAGGAILLVEILRPALSGALVVGTYPSANAALGVVAAGVATYLVAAHTLRFWGPFVTGLGAGALAALVGFAPTALGHEMPTDFLGGVGIGLGWLSVCILLVEFGLKRTPKPPA